MPSLRSTLVPIALVRATIGLAALAAPLPLRAQHAVTLVVLDSATREPVRRAHAWSSESRRSARGGEDGVMRLDSLGAGRHIVELSCETRRMLRPARLATIIVDVPAADSSARTVRVSARECDQRPTRELVVRLRGHHEGGFEYSRFRACASDRDRLPDDLRYLAADSVWVSTHFREAHPVQRWPNGQKRDGYMRWYVEVVGTLRGPGRYDHLGVAEYEITVDSTLALRKPRGDDCRGAPPRPSVVSEIVSPAARAGPLATYWARCDSVAARVRGPLDSVATFRALRGMFGCQERFYPRPSIAPFWRAAPDDREALAALVSATEDQGGEPLLRAALAAARDRAQPAEVRLYAMGAAVGFVVPSAALAAAQMAHDPRALLMLPAVDHATYASTSSIHPTLRDTIRHTLRGLAADPDTVVALAAQALFRAVAWQGERWTRDGPARCAAMAAELDRRAPPRGLSAWTGAMCPTLVPPAIARRWRASTGDTADVALLLALSQRLADERVLAAALDVARDARRPVPLRYAALHAAATLAHPSLYAFGPGYFERVPPDSQRCAGWWGTWRHHAEQEAGAEPLRPDAPRRVVSALHGIARRERDPGVRAASALLARCVEDASGTGR